jgi:hypothetical protein
MNWTADVVNTIRDTVYICRPVSFSISVQHPERFPGGCQICWRFCHYLLRYSDYTLSVVSTSTKLTVFIRFSTLISRFFNNVYSTFSNFETYISLLHSVFDLVTIFDTTSINQCHKTHLRYYSPYDSWYDKTAFLSLEHAKCSQLFPIKLTVRTLPAA